MKTLVRIAVLLFVVLAVFYYMETRVKENRPLESPVKQGTATPVGENGVGAVIPQTSRPEIGISAFVGKNVDELNKTYGKPDRIEPSSYGYDWWIYLGDEKIMASVTDDGVINQLYTTDVSLNITPFKIGQSISDIYRFTIVGSEINAEIDENIYTFSLNNEDLQTRPLIVFKGLFAQLYIDQEDGELEAVRFIDPATLVLHQPYEMTYTGELLVSSPPSSTLQSEVDLSVGRQIFELTNIYRVRHGAPELERYYELDMFAREYSKEMALESFIVDESSETEKLSNRLKEAMIEHRKAGENIAFDYADAIEAVHGWLNSPSHRKVLLDKDFTHIGTGAYGNYYAQSLIKATKDEIRQK